MKQVCQDLNLPKSPTYSDLLSLIGTKSILITEGPTWKHQRKSFNPGFSTFFLKQMLPTFIDKTRTFLNKLDSAAQQGREIKIHEEIILLTSEVIAKVAFGIDVPVQTHPELPVHEKYIKVLELVNYYNTRFYAKPLLYLPAYRQELEQATKEYDQVLVDLVKDRIEKASQAARFKALNMAGKRDKSSDDHSISHGMLKEEDEEELRAKVGDTTDILGIALNVAAESGNGSLDLEDVVSQMWVQRQDADEAFFGCRISSQKARLADPVPPASPFPPRPSSKTFNFAGFDTSSSALAWVMYHLSRNPSLESRLIAELDTVLGKRDSPTPEDLSQLTFLDKLVKETLRLHPPAASARWAGPGTTLLGKYDVSNSVIPGTTLLGKYDVSNSVIYMPTYLIHRDPQVYGPTAEQFDPDRWTEEFTAQLNPWSFIPFSKGPRDCIGQRLALIEIKTILAMVYKRFRFKWLKEFEEKTGFVVTSHPVHGVPLLPVRREDVVA